MHIDQVQLYLTLVKKCCRLTAVKVTQGTCGTKVLPAAALYRQVLQQ